MGTVRELSWQLGWKIDSAAIKKADDAVNSISKKTKKVADEADKLTRNPSRGFGGFFQTIKQGMGLFVGFNIADKIREVSTGGIKLASDLMEVQNVVDVTFGKNASQIDTWSKAALKSFGLSELQAKQYTGTMGAMLKSMGLTGEATIKMSESMTGLAGDFASFYNIAQEDAFIKIRAGIAGEVEPLRQLGINMSVANLEAYALSKGIKTSYDKMDQASQSALRYSYLMSVSKDAQGDFTRTSGSFANQLRLAKTNVDQFASKLAVNLLPALTKGLNKMNKFVDTITSSPERMNKIKSVFSDIGKGIGFAIDNIGTLTSAVKTVTPLLMGLGGALLFVKIQAMSAAIVGTLAPLISSVGFAIMSVLGGAATFGEAMLFLMGPVGWVALGIGALITVGVLLYKNWDWVSLKLQNIWIGMKNGFKFIINGFIDDINFLLKAINLIPGIKIPLINELKYEGFKSPNADEKESLANFNAANRESYGMNKFAGGVNNFRGGMALVGERGPEVVNLPGGSDVIPNSRAFGGNNNQTISIHAPITINGDNKNARDIANQVKAMFDDMFYKISLENPVIVER